MYYTGFCPICGEGLLGIRMCAAQKHGCVLCDECDTVWTDVELGTPVDGPELCCPECGADLARPPAHWASREEIERLGWSDAIIGEGWALGDAPPDQEV